jgi:hypothetical protein
MFHAQFLHVRNCNNLIQSDNFQIAYQLASKEEQDEILLAIAETNRERIKAFINDKLIESTPFEQLSLCKLRDIGAHLNIPYYNNLSKLELIESIKNVAERLKKDSKRKHFQSQQTESSREDFARVR